MEWLTQLYDSTGAAGDFLPGIAAAALVVLFVVFDGYLLAGGARKRAKNSRFVLGSLETHLLWTLVPVFLVVFLLKLPADSKKPSGTRHQAAAKPSEEVPQSTKVVFE